MSIHKPTAFYTGKPVLHASRTPGQEGTKSALAGLASAREVLLAFKEHHQEQKASKHAHIDALYRDVAEHIRQVNLVY